MTRASLPRRTPYLDPESPRRASAVHGLSRETRSRVTTQAHDIEALAERIRTARPEKNGRAGKPAPVDLKLSLCYPRMAHRGEAADSVVVFASCVIEYVSDLGPAMDDLMRVAGPDKLFIVTVGWLETIAPAFSPSRNCAIIVEQVWRSRDGLLRRSDTSPTIS